MKTILKRLCGFSALLAFLGLLPFSFAETTPATMAPSQATASAATKKPAPAKSRAKATPDSPPSKPNTARQTQPENKVTLTSSQKDKLLALLNEGSAGELADIPGIGETRAKAIAASRPFRTVDEIDLVDGVGNATYQKILSHGKSLMKRPGSPASKPVSRKS